MNIRNILSLITVLLLGIACTGGNYYRKQTALYREAVEKTASATTVAELEAINDELCDRLKVLEEESVEEKARIKESIANDNNAYQAELDELLNVQREYIDKTYKKLHGMQK